MKIDVLGLTGTLFVLAGIVGFIYACFEYALVTDDLGRCVTLIVAAIIAAVVGFLVWSFADATGRGGRL